MKIVSLQSVGLGTFYVSESINEPVYTPLYVGVGCAIDNLRGGRETDRNGDLIEVVKIDFGDMYHGSELPKQEGTYFVYTSDGHIRVLPADKYVAEWS